MLQRRFDGSVNFNQNWNAYKYGFGNLSSSGEFWLGLENIYAITNQAGHNYSLQIQISDWNENSYTAEYGKFRIEDEENKYKLRLSDYKPSVSNAGDSLSDSSEQNHNGMAFSTYDSDNDLRFYDNCAQVFKSGWWFNKCFNANLNGIYYNYTAANINNNNKKRSQLAKLDSKNVLPREKEENIQLRFLRNGIHWNKIDYYKSLKSTKIRIRRNDF